MTVDRNMTNWQISKSPPLLSLLRLTLVVSLWVHAGCRSSEPIVPQFSIPVFDPNLRSIIYSRRIGAHNCFIYAADLNTRVATRLTETQSGCETDPAISRDSNLIAFTRSSSAGKNSAIVLRQTERGSERVLVDDTHDNSQPTFVPFSNRLVFLRAKSFSHSSPLVDNHRRGFDVYSVDYDGSVVQLTHCDFYGANRLSVSDDGLKFIVSASGASGWFFGVGSAQPPGGPIAILQPWVLNQPPSGAEDINAVWLPNSTAILFSAASRVRNSENFDFNIYRFDIQRNQAMPLTSLRGMMDGFSVCPGGSRAIILRNGGFWILDLRTYKISGFEPLYRH